MALNGFAAVANIGSFVLQAVSFGQCTMNKYGKIHSRLIDATGYLKDAITDIREYSIYLNNKEFNESISKWESTMREVVTNLKTDAACKSFLVTVKTYQESKASAQKILIASVEVYNEVRILSTKAKRREDEKKRQIDEFDNNERLKRINQIGMVLTQTTLTGADLTYNPGMAVAPSRLGNETNSPFRDPSTGTSNLATQDAGDISLQRVTPN